MKVSTTQLEIAIASGLKYLEKLFASKPWAFSSISYTKDRVNFTAVYDYPYTGTPEKFTHFLALSLLGNNFSSVVRSNLVQSLLPPKPELLNYFAVATTYPDEVDTTSWGYAALLKTNVICEQSIWPVAEKVFSNIGDNGVVQIHFDPKDERRKNMVCPCICANVLHLAYLMGQEGKLQKTEQFVFEWLQTGRWKEGTLYYPSGLVFLFLCSNFVKTNFHVQNKFKTTLLSAIESCLEDCHLPVDFALALLTLENLGKRDHSKKLSLELLQIQEEDGSWPADAIWGDRYRVQYGGKALSTIFIVGALAAANAFD